MWSIKVKKMSRYAIFVKNYSIDNSQPWLTDDLATELHERGNDISVFFFDLKGTSKKGHYKRDENFNIYVYPLKKVSNSKGISKKVYLLIGFLGMYAYFIPKLLKQRFDAVISFSMFSIFFGLNKILRLRARNNIKSTAILWDFYPVHMIEVGKINNPFLAKLLYKLENYEFKHFDEICCMTNKSVEFFDKYHPNLSNKPKKVIYLWRKFSKRKPNLIDSKHIRFNTKKSYVTFGGQLSKGRGLEFLIDVALKHQKDLPNVEFIVIGEGELRPLLEETIKKEKLSNFHLVGRVQREEYLTILSKSQIGLVITQGDVSIPSFPSKTIDYMLMKLPIIACVESTTDYGDIIENQIGCGLSSNTDDKIAFVNNINILLKNKDLRKEMGNKGFSFLHENMSVSHVVDTILK